MLNLHNRYISAFFKQRKHHNANMSKELHDAYKSLCKDNSIVVTKPDKGKGVVVLNRTDVSKMEEKCWKPLRYSLIRNCRAIENTHHIGASENHNLVQTDMFQKPFEVKAVIGVAQTEWLLIARKSGR